MIARRLAGRDLAAGVLALAFAAAAAYESAKLPFGAFRSPGPGFFPWWTSLGVVVLGLLVVSRAGRRPARAAAEASEPPAGRLADLVRVGGLVAALAAYVALLEPLGYPLGTVLLVLFMLRMTERRPWPVALGAAAAIAVGSYVVFARWLGVPLPPGPFGR